MNDYALGVPQALGTSSSPTFAGLTVTGAATFASTVTATGRVTCSEVLVASQCVYGAAATATTGFEDRVACIGYGGPGDNGLYARAIYFSSDNAYGLATVLRPDAVDVLAQRRGVNPQAHRVYNSISGADSTFLGSYWSGGAAWILTQQAGAGAFANLNIGTTGGACYLRVWTNGVNRWQFSGAGDLVPEADNTYSVGSETNRLFFVWSVYARIAGSCTAGQFLFPAMGGFWSGGDGVIVMKDTDTTSFGRLCFGGTTNAFPALRRNGTTIEAVKADESDYAALRGTAFKDANNVQVLGARGAAVPDATGGATVDTEARAAINALLARCRATGGHGLIAD